MKLGIDASNIRTGGGITHLVALLRVVLPHAYGFDQVLVWGGSTILNRLEDRPWLRKMHDPLLDKALPLRFFWRRVVLERRARREECHVLFVPGGSYTGAFRPFVTLSQNILPFEWSETRRYGASWTLLRLMLLRRLQIHSFRAAAHLIFLTSYARDVIMPTMQQPRTETTIISHGVGPQFMLPPRTQKPVGSYSQQHPFRILYVSTIDMYKHQWHVAEAVALLRRAGLPLQLDFIGPAYPPALKRLRQTLCRVDPIEAFLHYRGAIPYAELPKWYHQADLFVFASSCENMPNILLEAMAAGLPIACSKRGPMPEVLGETGSYFDPEQPADIAQTLEMLINSPPLRAQKAEAAYARVQNYTWERCAHDTFVFLKQVVRKQSSLCVALQDS